MPNGITEIYIADGKLYVEYGDGVATREMELPTGESQSEWGNVFDFEEQNAPSVRGLENSLGLVMWQYTSKAGVIKFSNDNYTILGAEDKETGVYWLRGQSMKRVKTNAAVIAESSFEGSGIEVLEARNVSRIEAKAFMNCTSLRHINIGSNDITMGEIIDDSSGETMVYRPFTGITGLDIRLTIAISMGKDPAIDELINNNKVTVTYI